MVRRPLAACLAAALFALGAAGRGDRTGTGAGEVTSKTATKDGKSFIVGVLSPGEEKPRTYRVKYDPEGKAPLPDPLKAVQEAGVGDRVEFDWVATGHGPAVTRFKVVRKAEKK